MVKRIAPFLAYSVFFILTLMYFTPKISIYYFLETLLEEKSVVLSGEDVKDKGFSLAVRNTNISYESISSANIGETTLKIYGIYNSIYLENIVLSSVAKSFVPLHVENVKVTYFILNPLNIKAYGIGEFGEVEAKLNIIDRVLHVELKPSALMKRKYKSTLNNFVKNEEGEYSYDQNF